ncbi:unnamed protein product, partial [Rotaria magnacalcarata]
MNERYRRLYRLGRRPGEQGPRPLSRNQDRVEKLATGTNIHTTTSTTITTTLKTPIASTLSSKMSTKGDPHRLKLTKNTITVGTWNVRTLWAAGQLELLRNEMKQYKYDVVGISEVRWTGKGQTSIGDFIWSGENSMHTKGVGLLLSTRARQSLLGYNPVNSRIITARLRGKPFNVTIINVYAPTSDATDDDIEAFYGDLERSMREVPKKDILVITGDWNAKVGNDNRGWESAMVISNTLFQQKPSRKWTWESPDGIHKNMIDLIIVQKRWRTSVINCRTFQGADISSDHSLVLCNIKLRLKKLYNQQKGNNRPNTNQLNEQAIRKMYQTNLENNLNSIQTNGTLEEHALKIRNSINEAIEVSITNQRVAKKPWISAETLKLADEKRKAKQTKHLNQNLNEKYKELCKKVKKFARKDKEGWIEDQCKEIQEGLQVGNSKQAYNLVKLLKRKYVSKLNIIRKKDGKIAQSKEDVLQTWTQYCSGLYEDIGGGES